MTSVLKPRRIIIILASMLFFALGLFAAASFAQQCPTVQTTNVALQNSNDDIYYGNCPCPYNFDKSSERCGDKSLWSITNGHTPVCFPMTDQLTNQPFILPTKPLTCPCPYNYDEHGRCGDRSLWSISGGQIPACFTSTTYLNEGLTQDPAILINKCRCPYDSDENGRCGDRSEWTRTRGAVACY